MAIRTVTKADFPALLRLMRTAYPEATADDELERTFSDPNPFQAIIGDPSVPVFLRAVHYRLPSDFPIFPGQNATQITDMYPMSVDAAVELGIVREEDVTAGTGLQLLDQYIIPLLAEGLGRAVEAFPVNSRGDGIPTRPVWGFLAPALGQAIRAHHLPMVQFQGTLCWGERLGDLATAIAGRRP